MPSNFGHFSERQDWLDEMRNSASKKWNKSGDFVTVCHGQPWSGNAYFKYSTDPEGGQVPTEVIFSDFQSCALGKPGQDISHFLLSSTTREFRQDNLETILQAYLTELEDVITHQGDLLHLTVKNYFLQKTLELHPCFRVKSSLCFYQCNQLIFLKVFLMVLCTLQLL